MIVRIWHGRTPKARADEYGRFLTMTRWSSEEAVGSFAGSDVLRATYYPEDADYLLEFEEEVRHFTALDSRP